MSKPGSRETRGDRQTPALRAAWHFRLRRARVERLLCTQEQVGTRRCEQKRRHCIGFLWTWCRIGPTAGAKRTQIAPRQLRCGGATPVTSVHNVSITQGNRLRSRDRPQAHRSQPATERRMNGPSTPSHIRLPNIQFADRMTGIPHRNLRLGFNLWLPTSASRPPAKQRSWAA
jgi:hypothetical protein